MGYMTAESGTGGRQVERTVAAKGARSARDVLAADVAVFKGRRAKYHADLDALEKMPEGTERERIAKRAEFCRLDVEGRALAEQQDAMKAARLKYGI